MDIYVNLCRLESDLRHHFEAVEDLRYVQIALNTFPTPPIFIGKLLTWPRISFETSHAVESERTQCAGYGYDPYPCMLFATKRLCIIGDRMKVIYDAWKLADFHSHHFRSKLLQRLFMETVPTIDAETFAIIESAFNPRIIAALSGTARRLRNVSPSYPWLKRITKAFTNTMRVYDEEDDRLITACQLASGVHRRKRSCYREVIVKREPRSWSFRWTDCALIISDKITYYERRDERLKWISVLLWEVLMGRLSINRVPLCVLLAMSEG